MGGAELFKTPFSMDKYITVLMNEVAIGYHLVKKRLVLWEDRKTLYKFGLSVSQ